MPRVQRELARLQFQQDFLNAQARYDFMEPEDDCEIQADEADLSLHYYSVRHDA